MNERSALVNRQDLTQHIGQDMRTESEIFDDKLLDNGLRRENYQGQEVDDNQLSVNDIKRQLTQKLAQSQHNKWQNVNIKTYFARNIIPLVFFAVLVIIYLICYFLLCGLAVVDHVVAYGPSDKVVTFFWKVRFDDNQTFPVYNKSIEDTIQPYIPTSNHTDIKMNDAQFPYQILINSSYTGLNIMKQLTITQNKSSSRVVIKTQDPARRYVSFNTPWFGLSHWNQETMEIAPDNVVYNSSNGSILAFCYPPTSQSSTFKILKNVSKQNGSAIYSYTQSGDDNTVKQYLPSNYSNNQTPLGDSPYYFKPNNVPIWLINLDQLAYGRCNNRYCNKDYELTVSLPAFQTHDSDIYSCIAPFVFRDLINKISINLNNIQQFDGDIWLDLMEGTGNLYIQNISNINLIFNAINDTITFTVDVESTNSFSITLVNESDVIISQNNIRDAFILNDNQNQYINFYGLITNFTGNKMLNYKLKYEYSSTFYFNIVGYDGYDQQNLTLSADNNVLKITYINKLQIINSQITIYNSDNYTITADQNNSRFVFARKSKP